MRRILALVSAWAAGVGLGGHGPALLTAQAATVPAAAGFQFPESAYWDAPTASWYVSNFGGVFFNPGDRVPDGFISKLGADGRLVERQWVTGLRSPKGMRRAGSALYVADVGQLVVIDVPSARIEATVDLEPLGAMLPNDVAVHPGTSDVYVTDTRRNAIYRLPAGSVQPEVFLESPLLEAPNGILAEEARLVIAAFGIDPDGTGPQPRGPGRVLEVDLSTKAVAPLGNMDPVANLDGIERLGDSYLVTDNPGGSPVDPTLPAIRSSGAGRLLRVGADGSVDEVDSALPSAADLGLRPESSIVGVPLLRAHSVRFLRVEVASACLGSRCARPDPPTGGSDSLRPPSPKLARSR